MAFLVPAHRLPAYVARYLRLFTWRRAANLLLVASSLGLSRLCRRPIVWGRPLMLMVEPTNLCNLKCPLCPSGNGQLQRPRGQMALEDFKKLVDQVSGHAFMLLLWNQGEPYINRQFDELVSYARSRRMFTCTSTNGHFIRTPARARAVVDSGLDELVFSVDGVDQATYAKYRVNGRLDRVLEAIRLVLQARREARQSTPRVSLQYIVMRHNETDLAAVEELARNLGVDRLLIKTAQVYTDEEARTFLPAEAGLSRYERDRDGGLQVVGQPARGCKVLWYSSMVNWDGTVTPCCFDKDADFAMGNACGSGSFGRIWVSRSYRRFRAAVLRDRRAVSMCTNCSEGYRGMFSVVKELVD